jgi:hypothetical protein
VALGGDPPPVGHPLDEEQAPAAGLIESGRPGRVPEPGARVGHRDPDGLGTKLDLDIDPLPPVEVSVTDAVGDQLAHQELEGLTLLGSQVVREPLHRSAGFGRGASGGRQPEVKFARHLLDRPSPLPWRIEPFTRRDSPDDAGSLLVEGRFLASVRGRRGPARRGLAA